ncbi:MAG TPA: hypothetical protein VG518_00915, partial [Solirubrobacterales bacterium]|nr:hypothetical protein [Solirubrobacterales bacterium]
MSQQFWSEDPGLVPLLLAMGAGSMAFVPLRPAIIAEGPSDLILLPSLIKEAIRKDRLGYQVVPGAAQSPPTRIAGLDLSGIRTIWIVDGDQGGEDRRKFLFDNGIPEDRLHLLSDHTGGLELEDLIHSSTYVKAVNAYVEDLGNEDVFEEQDLSPEPC